MKRFGECMKAFLEALCRVGQDCGTDLKTVWADFRKDMAQLWADLCRDMKTLAGSCREMMAALAAEVRLTVQKWVG